MPKILVIDDDPDFVESIRLMLEPHGHVIASAGSGDEGLRQISAEKPDLVILDVIMSTILDGLYVSQRMQESAEYKNIPIIMVTSIANTDYAALFPTDQAIHIDAFLTKPISAEQLLSLVQRLLR